MPSGTTRKNPKPYTNPDKVYTYCVKCTQEVRIGTNFYFDQLREAAKLEIASKELQEYKVVALDDLSDKAAPELEELN